VQTTVEHTTHSLLLMKHHWRRVFCVIENAYREVRVADDACEGVFTNAGVAVQLGTQPDWFTTALPPDEEWRIEWYKFYYGLNLAHAFALTGDEKYRRVWQQLVRSWIAQVPVGWDSSDVAARRIQNWIYAWNAFSLFSSFETTFEDQLVSSLAAQVVHLRHNLTAERNHRTLELYALFIATLALPELDQGELLAFAIAELHRNLLTDVRRDGVHREHSTHYHMTALRSFLGARENANRFGLDFPASYNERLEKACEFLLHVQRPDGLIPALSDADTGNYSDLLELAAVIFNRSDFLYAATAGNDGKPPRATSTSFPEGGYYIQRSGWGEGATQFTDERYLVFDCGPLGDGGHGHYDLLNIEVAANGKPLIIDPGRFTYADDEEHWRRRFKSTAAHNTVCIDDLDQVPYHRGKPKCPFAQARLRERFTEPGLDMLCGEVRSPAYETIHTRRLFFVAGEYWLVIDSLRGHLPHRFDLRFHLTPAALNRCSLINAPGNSGIRTPELVLLFAPDRQPALSDGWVSPLYGVKELAPVVSIVSQGQTNADFFTLIVPRKPGAPLPRLIVQFTDLDLLKTGHVRIEGAGDDFQRVDGIAWADGARPLWRRTSS
jgi:Heparinase II/III-like protein/Heparinase II/III N-terminus